MKKLQFVNALIGSDNEQRYSNGNIYPVTSTPWGMANWCIQTNGNAYGWFYNPNQRIIEGIRLTHQPSPWIGDYGHLLFNFMCQEKEEPSSTFSSFRPENAQILPDYISVSPLRYRIKIELCPTERGGIFKITSKNKMPSVLELSPFGSLEVNKISDNEVVCQTETTYSFGRRKVKEYLYLYFDTVVNNVVKKENGKVNIELGGNDYTLKVATSFISEAQAKITYDRELKDVSFETNRANVADKWEDCLGRIELHEKNTELNKTFYSCMYRAFLYPRKFYEYDESGKIVHYNADENKVFDGVFYTDNGFWDTYRTVYPLLSIICPTQLKEMMEGFINFYNETGWMPRWISPGECGLMPGTLFEAVIADCAVKGIIDGELLDKAYKGMIKNATVDSNNGIQGRKCICEYNELGYIPYDKLSESINNTLDCAYGDFCISQVAKLLGDKENYEYFLGRSKNYKNIFNAEHGLMIAKDGKGNFEPFDSPCKWGSANCEGSYWQNSFAVYHDIDGLASLYGGKDKFIAKLDELFNTEPVFEVGGYKFEIHEMSEMAAVDFGQCAISNQPSFHIPWLYTLLGQKEKTVYYTQKLAKEAFNSSVSGFPGDEDNGTTACWYIFACLGFYPVCPGKDEYVLSKPIADATINLENGKKIKITKNKWKKANVLNHFSLLDNN